MMNINKILCPVDFSEPCAVALRAAQDFAHKFDAKLLVVHVLDEPAYSMPERGGNQMSKLVAEHAEAMESKMKEFTKSVDRSLSVEIKTVGGTAAETIATLAQQEGCELIVMGTHGRSGLRHVLLGSVTEKVLRIASAPVLVMRALAPARP